MIRVTTPSRLHFGLLSFPEGEEPGTRWTNLHGEETLPARRFGLTVTRKTGNSVVRNRIRRRLREALRTSGIAPTRLPITGRAAAMASSVLKEKLSNPEEQTTAIAARRSSSCTRASGCGPARITRRRKSGSGTR